MDLSSLINLVKEHAGDAIVNNPAVPNEHNDAAIATASSSIFDTLKNAVSNGQLGDITSMLSGGAANAANSPVGQTIQNDVIGALTSKLGLGQGAAAGVAASLIPNVLQSLVHKTNDPNDNSFNMGSILSNLGAGQQSGGGILGTIAGLFGKK